MRIIISIFALSMFLSCQEETSSGFRQCGIMILSDALPVQFWLTDCETFNEHEAQGVHHVCWCQPWNCNDELKIQISDVPGQNLAIRVLDSVGSVMLTKSLSEVIEGVYQTSIIFENEDICDELVRFEIFSDLSILAPTSWNDTDAWTSKNATQFIALNTDGESHQAFPMAIGDNINFDYTVNVVGTDEYVSVQFQLLDSSFTPIESHSSGQLTTGVHNLTVALTATSDISYLRILGIRGPTGTFFSYNITIPVGENLGETIAKSDCLDIAESHDETIFIEYSNDTNYAGLVYEDISPDVTFGLRVPCRFFHEDEPEEDEAMELTSSVIITSSQVKTQRLLEVKHAPYYFHKKLRRVLKHQTLTIFDKQWKKEEKYEVIQGTKTWPLKAATVVLTEKNSVVRNVS